MRTLEVKAMALIETDTIELLKRKLTVTNFKTQEHLQLYKETDNETTLWIPRALVKLPADNANWKTYDNIQHSIQLKPQQKALIDNFLNYLKDNPCGGIIQAGTGTGKTIMGIWLACHFKLKTLIIVPTERIFHQWIERIKAFTNVKEVGFIRGSLCEYDSPFTVAMLHTIRKDRFDFLEKEFGLIIYDEIHTISTKHFNTVANKFWSKLRIGLSATPTRKDGMENVFFYHIGRIAVSNPNIEVVPKVILVKYYNPATYHGRYFYNGNLNLGAYVNKLVSINHRNLTIVKYLKVAYKQKHNILLLTERLNHIDTLIKLANLPKEDVGRLTGSIKEIDKQVIFGTYGSAGLGLDLPALTCLILATPRTDIVQPVGRITRVKSRTPIIIDFVDEASELMRAWAMKRIKYYNKLTKEVIHLAESI